TLLGALSALVSRQEDVGNVITPVIMLLMIPYIIAVSVAPWDPDNTLVTVLSLIPLFSPILMPVRIAMGVAPGWEIALTLGLSVLLVAVLVLVGGRVYERAITRTGARVPLREVLRG
ncbi:MAG: ABC transporter permease, partial [Cellulomonadaceae bacterium]